MAPPRMLDVWERPAFKHFARQVIDDMEPKLISSRISIMLAPGRVEDVKFWVELGASIMHDKPIIAVVWEDKPIPDKLARVADEIVVIPEGGSMEDAQDDLKLAMQRLMDDLHES